MSTSSQSLFLGADLSVLPFLVADDGATVDLATRARLIRPGSLAVLRRSFPALPVDDRAVELTDLDVMSGRQNLAQALILRLLTPRGSLAALGHGAYGSRLSELIGQPRNAATRALCRAFVLEVVAQEPRVEDQAVSLTFDVEREDVSSFQFTLAVQPRDGGAPLGLSLGVAL
jgi:phage baseplate assembly protein W